MSEYKELVKSLRNVHAKIVPLSAAVGMTLTEDESAVMRAATRIEELAREVGRLESAIMAIAEDGWLWHGIEGMNPTQQVISDITLEIVNRRKAALTPPASTRASPADDMEKIGRLVNDYAFPCYRGDTIRDAADQLFVVTAYKR